MPACFAHIFAQVGPEDGGSTDKEIVSQPTLSESDEDEGAAVNNKLSSEETLDEQQVVESCNNGKGRGGSDAFPAARLAGEKINRINSSVEKVKITPRLASARSASQTSSKMESTALVLLELAEHTKGIASSRTNSELECRESAEFQWAKQNVDWNGRYVSSSTKVKRTSDTSNLLTPRFVSQDELLAYRQQHGNCNVPAKYEKNTSLGFWVRTQTQEYKKYRKGGKSYMTEERIAKLEKVGFAWSLAKWGVDWDERYVSSLERERACQLKSYSHHSPTLFTSSLQAELLAYRQQHGNCNVPLKYEKNTSLGVWVSNQRQQYKKYQKGGKSSLTEERIAKLEKVGFAWSLANRHLSWDDRYVSS